MPPPPAGGDDGGPGPLPGQHGRQAEGVEARRGDQPAEALGVQSQHPGTLGGPGHPGQTSNVSYKNPLLKKNIQKSRKRGQIRGCRYTTATSTVRYNTVCPSPMYTKLS